MASDFSIRAVNDWRREVHTDLNRALRVSMDVWHKDAENACKRMLILMAQSARALTPQAKMRRRVERDKSGQYVEVLRQGRESAKRYKWQYDREDSRGTWEGAQQIRNRGLARRSWLWGLQRAGAKGSERKPIPGTSLVDRIRKGRLTVGWFKENRLKYIEKIMPAGWLQTVERKAVNRVMKQAETKMVREFERRVGRK